MSSTAKNKKRMFHILIFLTTLFLIVIGRLLDIQIINSRDFSSHHVDLVERSVQQRKQGFVLSTGRGNIYDRNLNSLLGQNQIKTVIVFPLSKQYLNGEEIDNLAKVLKLSSVNLYKQVNDLKNPTFIARNGKAIEITKQQQEQIENMQIPGVIATDYTTVEQNEMLGKHIVGYLAQAPKVVEKEYKAELEQGILRKDSSIGRSGLQLTFQSLLMGVGESKIAYFVDSSGKPLNGLGSKYQNNQNDSFFPLSLVTTIDKVIQKLAEKQLQKEKIKEGSVVVLDVENGDILAMASAPDFDINRIDPSSADSNNKAVQVIEPGSIFKTVIAIAGLEEGVVTPNETFYCDGALEQYHFTCHDEHGELTFAEGYAESCNIVFAEVAKRLGPEKIEEYASKLGVVGKVGWQGEFFNNTEFQQIANEQLNRVFHEQTNQDDLGEVIRTAIGQQDVRLSPLAAANLVVTILNNGEVSEPRMVDKVIYKNGTDYFQFPLHQSKKLSASEDTFSIVQQLMKKVVDDGTGKILESAKWQLAGKSGTAETGNGLYQQWFIGFGPYEHPKYALAVAVKNVSTTTDPLAKKVFLGVMDGLVELK